MNGIEKIDGLKASFNLGKNHEGEPSIFLYQVDAVERCDGFTIDDLNTFIDALTERQDRLELIEESKHQKLVVQNRIWNANSKG